MIDKIKITILAGQLVVGGAERQLYLWLSNLDRARFDPIVLTLHPGHKDYWEQPIEALGIPLFRVSQRKNRLLRLIEIANILRPFQPELIHGWHLFASAYAGLVAKLLGTKCLGGVRSTYETFLSHRLESWIMLHTSHVVVANSERTAEAIRQSVHHQHPLVFTVQNTIEDDFLPRDEAREKLIKDYCLPANTFWLVSIGRLDPLKRFDSLLNMSANLARFGCNFHTVILGDGPERLRLEALVRSLGIQNYVTLTGEVPEARKWLKGFDIFVFPSVDEGMPNVIMEAGAAGLPIVTWQMPFYDALLTDGRNALLVEPEKMDAMEKAIVRLCQDASLRQRLGQSAREHILTTFSPDRYTREMTQVYHTVLGE